MAIQDAFLHDSPGGLTSLVLRYQFKGFAVFSTSSWSGPLRHLLLQPLKIWPLSSRVLKSCRARRPILKVAVRTNLRLDRHRDRWRTPGVALEAVLDRRLVQRDEHDYRSRVYGLMDGWVTR